MGAVQDVLGEAGFRDITFYDAQDVGMSGSAGYARTFFLGMA